MSEQKQVLKVFQGLFQSIRFPREIVTFMNRISLLLVSRGVDPRTKRMQQRPPEPSLVLAQSWIELQLLGCPQLDVVVEDLAHPASELFR
jgi:hypothetical protein